MQVRSHKITRSPPIGGQAKHHDSRIRPKAVSIGIFDYFFRCAFRPKVVGDVMFGVLVDSMSVKLPVKFRHSMSHCPQDIRLPHFVTNDNNPVR